MKKRRWMPRPLPADAEPATGPQRRYLRGLGAPWQEIERVTKRTASKWIARLLRERQQQTTPPPEGRP